ncbi:MAG: hypothetical protein ACR2KT_15690 [Methylocella sp.]|nr:MAG: hypothetical protein DLM68_14165 [Hyphomicrobiales bacterium]
MSKDVLGPIDNLAELKAERAAITAAIARVNVHRAKLGEVEDAERAAAGRLGEIASLEAAELQAWVENGAVGPMPGPHTAERGEAEGAVDETLVKQFDAISAKLHKLEADVAHLASQDMSKRVPSRIPPASSVELARSFAGSTRRRWHRG